MPVATGRDGSPSGLCELVLDSKKRFDYEHEHHFIEHENDGVRKEVGNDEASALRLISRNALASGSAQLMVDFPCRQKQNLPKSVVAG